jgi:hypothetical protein
MYSLKNTGKIDLDPKMVDFIYIEASKVLCYKIPYFQIHLANIFIRDYVKGIDYTQSLVRIGEILQVTCHIQCHHIIFQIVFPNILILHFLFFYMFMKSIRTIHVTLFAGLLFFHLDLGMEPSLEGGLWLANPSVSLHSHSQFCLYGKKNCPI